MPRRRLAYLLTVVALLGGMAFAMVTTALQQAPTIDEPVYVATAEVLTQQHSLRYNPEHPPLGKLLMATGLAFDDVRLDPSYPGDQTRLGRHLLYETGHNPFRLMLLARLPMILLTLAIGLVVLGFARDLAGPRGGLVALALYAFSPDVIAHGSLATLDVPAAGMLLTSFWMLWRSRERPRLYLPLAGLALGAALATRMSALPAVPIVVALAALSPAVLGRPATWWRSLLSRAAAAIGVGLLAVAVVWLVYLAVDPRLRWTTPVPNPGGLKGLAVDLLPFPKAYRDGVLIQFRFESRSFNGFLLGRAYRGSLWYYLPVALLIKTPLGMLAMWLAGIVTMVVKPALRIALLYLLLPATALMLIAMTGARDYGTRYVVFVPIFLAVVAGTVVLLRFRFARIGAGVLVAYVAVSSMLTFPYYLPYSNEAFGGTSHTHLNLHDSNVDWGQDLARLGTRLRERYPNEPVWLVYKGAGVPGYYGIQGRNPLGTPSDEVHGLLVVSDSRVALAKGQLKQLIDTSTEIDNVGYSIRIYRR
ncbi:phospholipid carrier-dependent glycosyltransferase [Paractinoplanes ferrugineus]|uniref:Glycosyl transferase n=1 Tax=Paractinoplanes ferrugineus TaxID=113564 RepID=A0A919IUV6_9ACTN|nr:glycosyltransferase family 39 protein [Actinoplanes ferrugineus]GIE09400.1 glycosyl transferase [Actinoplanes ferrugineus]